MKIDNTLIQNSIRRVPERAPEDPQKLMEVSREFEAIFLDMMLRQMRSTVVEGGLTEKSHAREIFESMYDKQLALEISRGQGIGLAQKLFKQLSRHITSTDIKNQD